MTEISGFQIQETLYDNGQSCVHRAIRESDGCSVILRSCGPKSSDHQKRRLMFSGDLLARFDHSGIVELLAKEGDEQETSGYLNAQSFTSKHDQSAVYLVLEDIGAIDLRTYSEQFPNQQVPIETFLDIAIQLADALSVIHHAQVIHKDLHSGNIVINPNTGRVQIIDFGLASLLSREQPGLAPPENLEGVLPYLSPEQTGRMNRALDYRTDFYTLGVTLYQLLCGRLPFEAEDAIGWVHSHIAKVQVSVCKRRNDVPEVLSNIVDKLLQKTAEKRYQSALGLKHDLERCREILSARPDMDTGDVESFPLGEHDVSERFQIPQVLYGREYEIEFLMNKFALVEQGKPQLLVVKGHAGIGKSALIHEVHKPIAASQGLFLSGKFDQFQKNVPYSALKQALKGWIQQALMLRTTVFSKLRHALNDALGTNARVLIDFMDDFRLVLGDLPEVAGLAAQERQTRFHLTFQRFIQFITRYQPLVIFIDDLQWADQGTLNLLSLLLERGDAGISVNQSEGQGRSTGIPIKKKAKSRLLLLVAYRDNEVDAAHPAQHALNHIHEEHPSAFSTISLLPLSVSCISILLRDALHRSIDEVQPLALRVHQKTAGNPFFVNEFLKTLYSDGLLYFNLDKASWQWDLKQIDERAITDNVVELMLGKMKLLPLRTQNLLQLAACIGSVFDLQTLAVISQQTESYIIRNLWPALKEGLLLQEGREWLLGASNPRSSLQSESSNGQLSEKRRKNSMSGGTPIAPQCRFLHDRMLQAAYESLPEGARRQGHLAIGRLLLENTTKDTLDTQLFSIVEQMNHGLLLIDSLAEKLKLAELNLKAGEQAKTAGVWEVALNFAELGISLLPSDCWSEHQLLSYRLHILKLECLSLIKQVLNDDLQTAADLLIENLESPLHKAQVCFHLSFMMALANVDGVLISALQGLRYCGIDTPDMPEISAALASQEKAQLFDRMNITESISECTSIKEGVPEEISLAYRLFSQLGMAAQIRGNMPVMEYAVFKGIKTVFEHGVNEHAIILQALYATFLAKEGRLKEGRVLGLQALELLEEFPQCSDLPYVNLTLAMTVLPYDRPIDQVIDRLLFIHDKGYEYGDVVRGVFAGFSNSILYKYCAGMPFKTLESDFDKLQLILNRYKFPVSAAGLYPRLVAMLQGRSEQNMLSESAFESEEWQRIQGGVLKPVMSHLQLQWSFWSSDPENTVKAALDSESSFPIIKGFTFILSEHWFMAALMACRIEQAKSVPDPDAKYIQFALSLLETLVEQCPENFEHKLWLLKAEQGRLKGHVIEQLAPLYEDAIESAKTNGFIQFAALANELYGAFWLAQKRTRIAQMYLTDALVLYRKWGCQVKVKYLTSHYGEMVHEPISSLPLQSESLGNDLSVSPGTALKSSETQQGLDLTSLMKSTQAISSELDTKDLLKTVLQVIVENTGAQTGALVLISGDGPKVEIHLKPLPSKDSRRVFQHSVSRDAFASDGNSVNLSSRSLESVEDIPVSVIQYVLRSGQSVALQNVLDYEQQPALAKDPYFGGHGPKSVFCRPVTYREKVIGALYLENTLVTNAFMKERRDVIKLLLAQAVISFENARLFEEVTELNTGLEMKVEERTRALKNTQAQLVEAEKMAALGELVRGVAHELNTPLGIATTSASIVDELTEQLETKFQEQSITKQFIEDYFANVRNASKLLSSSIQRTGRLVNTFKAISVDEVVDTLKDVSLYETLMVLSSQISASLHSMGIAFVFNCPKSLTLRTFPQVLSDVIIQLVDNAKLHAFECQSEPEITITVSDVLNDSDWIDIEVKDNGKGMPVDLVEKIFDPFVTTKRGTDENTGLGTHIIFNLVTRKLGGLITCHSEEKSGTAFVISLPRVYQET